MVPWRHLRLCHLLDASVRDLHSAGLGAGEGDILEWWAVRGAQGRHSATNQPSLASWECQREGERALSRPVEWPLLPLALKKKKKETVFILYCSTAINNVVTVSGWQGRNSAICIHVHSPYHHLLITSTDTFYTRLWVKGFTSIFSAHPHHDPRT